MAGFVIVYKLYIRMRMRKELIKEQLYWILIYVQKRTADIWKGNVLTDLKLEDWKFLSAEELQLLIVLKKKFGGGNNKSTKI